MDAKVVSCEKKEFDGNVYYKLGVILNDVLGFVNSRSAYKFGDVVHLCVRTNRDNKFMIGIDG